jgi:hypothetical protein
LGKFTSAAKPTSRRTELGNEIRFGVDVLRHVRDQLFDVTAVDPLAVRRAVEGYLARRLARAPKRGKGARKRRFLERFLATAKRWRPGLYVTYGKVAPAVPHTSNFIESTNGISKRHLRRVGGRASTSGGPVESFGELLVPLVVEAKLKGVPTLQARALAVPRDDYLRAREQLAELAEPARRTRSVARAPGKALKLLLDRARAGPHS